MMIKIQFGDPSLDNHFFKKNLALLKDHISWPEAIDTELSEKITILDAKSGQPTAQHKNILLHSCLLYTSDTAHQLPCIEHSERRMPT